MSLPDALHILLVEDEPGDALLVQHTLRAASGGHCNVTWAGSLAEARERLAEQPMDLILLDLSLPDSAGLATVTAARNAARDTPVVVLTGHDDPEFALKVLEAGAQDYLVKGGFDGDALMRAMRHARVRAQLEARLTQSQQRLELALAGADLGLWDWHLPSGEITINARTVEMLGYPLAEFDSTADHWQGLVHPDDLTARQDARTAHLQGEQPFYEAEYRLHHRTGSWIWVFDRGRVVERDPYGAPLRMVGTLLDITERRSAEQALKESETKFRSYVESAPIAVLVTDADGHYQEVNSAAVALLGYSREQLLALTFDDIVPDRGRLAARSYFQRVKEEGRADGEYQLQRSDGALFWAAIHAVRLSDGRLMAFKQDVSERRRADQELRIAATAFESQEGMLVTDLHGAILRVNRAFCELTGYQPHEVIGHTPAILNSGRQPPSFYTEMWRQLERDGYWQGEIWNRRKNGDIYPEWLTITAVTGPEGGVTHYVGAFSDITDRKEAEERIRSLAFYDPLTGLPNRRLLHDRLRQALASSSRNSRHGALMFLDLDHFKTLNDTRGHDVGDQLLVEVARRIASCLRERDTVARMGGDEFVVMLEDLHSEPAVAAAQAEGVAEKIQQALAEPYRFNLPADRQDEPLEEEYHCTSSVGLSLFMENSDNLDELLKRSDVAMYQAKAAGRNTVRFFDPRMQAALEARAATEAELRRAADRNELRLHYQVQVDANHRVVGAEALLRWAHPSRGLVQPNDLIPLAEETGLIIPIGLWVLRSACEQLRRWQGHPATRQLTLAVNVSPRQFRQADFVQQVRTLLEESGTDPSRLKLELTESLVLHDIDDTIGKMRQLRGIGVNFSMDDFGTGYSSLSYLRQLPLDQLKIDRSFVRDLNSDPNDAAIVQTIISMGHILGLTVVAEGVETAAQQQFLVRNGCQIFQGFLFGEPQPIERFEQTALRQGALPYTSH